MTVQKPAVFFDRDGVLCQAVVREGRPYPPASLAELQLMPGARLACEALREAGYALVMVTNQPDVARGAQSRETVDLMNLWLQTELALDSIKVCPHQDSDACGCRKPAPGMLTEAAAELHIDLQRSFVVGDRWRDVAAGTAAGCRTVFIDYCYQEQRPENPTYTVKNLLEAVQSILLAEPGSASNSAADFLLSLVERTRSVKEFRKTPAAPIATNAKETCELALETQR